MNVNGLIGIKINQTQGFLEDGTRVPLSLISLGGNVVTQIKGNEKEGYDSVQVGFGTKRVVSKAEAGHSKKAGLEKAPRFLKEIRLDGPADVEIAAVITPEEVFAPGDIIDVMGTSKGKGFAGGVKRHHFAGGPKTHGQSDRHRAPGSIGAGTTPGRVYKGKRMAGKMGNEQVTIKNLLVLNIIDGVLYIKGLVPGVKGGLLTVTKVGTKKKFTPLYKKAEEVVVEEVGVEEVAKELKEAEVAAQVTSDVEEVMETPVETATEEVTEEIAVSPEENIEVASEQEEKVTEENKE
jgi:large subunit ribosomal protein L3